MWPRAIELMLGLWTVISPFVFQREPGPPQVWANALVCGAAIMTFSLLSFWNRTRWAYLLNLGVALWLAGFGYIAGGYPSEPIFQNYLLTGLVLLLFAIIPPEANKPPRPWRRHHEKRAEMLRR